MNYEVAIFIAVSLAAAFMCGYFWGRAVERELNDPYPPIDPPKSYHGGNVHDLRRRQYRDRQESES